VRGQLRRSRDSVTASVILDPTTNLDVYKTVGLAAKLHSFSESAFNMAPMPEPVYATVCSHIFPIVKAKSAR
jgi:hypothetical protein